MRPNEMKLSCRVRAVPARYRDVLDSWLQGAARPALIGCGRMGSTLMGPLQKVTNFDRLGEQIRPGTFGNIKVG